jgi:hypothetical protein
MIVRRARHERRMAQERLRHAATLEEQRTLLETIGRLSRHIEDLERNARDLAV